MLGRSNELTDFLVVGAGLAGLACAADLQAAGASVTVLDKGRGVGGRCATRRMPDARVDHGAQFFTARSERFKNIVERGLADGWIAEWYRTIPLWKDGDLLEREAGHPRYACPEGNSALPKFLASGLDVRPGDAVAKIERAPGGFTATTASGETVSAGRLALNLPPEQLLALAEDLLEPEGAAWLRAVTMEPRWAVISTLERDLPVTWPALELEGHPSLSWIARDHTKRPTGAPPTLVIHADADWTRARYDDPPETVISALLADVAALLGPVNAAESVAHRWKYAKTTAPLGEPYFLAGGVGACGDWCLGGRVEGAIQSGWALAAAILSEPGASFTV